MFLCIKSSHSFLCFPKEPQLDLVNKMAFYLQLAALLVIFTGCHGNIGYEGGANLNDALRLWQDQSLLDRAPSAQNVSDVCLQDLLKLFSGDPDLIQGK